MISTEPDRSRREEYISNIIRAWHQATEEQEQRGLSWYATAHDMAEFISGGHVRAGAGVIAALSANKSWSLNARLAEAAFTEGEARGHTRDTLAKVERIMGGEDPEDVLPMEAKTGHFYRCILDPNDPDPVVIDRHAHDVAVGEVYGNAERGLSSKRRYALLAHCYREAAYRLGEIPSAVQAVTWVAQVEKLRGQGTRNK